MKNYYIRIKMSLQFQSGIEKKFFLFCDPDTFKIRMVYIDKEVKFLKNDCRGNLQKTASVAVDPFIPDQLTWLIIIWQMPASMHTFHL